MIDLYLKQRMKYPCEITQDIATNAAVITAVGSGKTRRIEDPASEPHLTTALRAAYEDILREIEAEQQEQAA